DTVSTRACAGAVVFKIAVADHDFGGDDAGGEDAVLVVDEARPLDGQVSAFATYPGSVQITDTRPLNVMFLTVISLPPDARRDLQVIAWPGRIHPGEADQRAIMG